MWGDFHGVSWTRNQIFKLRLALITERYAAHAFPRFLVLNLQHYSTATAKTNSTLELVYSYVESNRTHSFVANECMELKIKYFVVRRNSPLKSFERSTQFVVRELVETAPHLCFPIVLLAILSGVDTAHLKDFSSVTVWTVPQHTQLSPKQIFTRWCCRSPSGSPLQADVHVTAGLVS